MLIPQKTFRARRALEKQELRVDWMNNPISLLPVQPVGNSTGFVLVRWAALNVCRRPVAIYIVLRGLKGAVCDIPTL